MVHALQCLRTRTTRNSFEKVYIGSAACRNAPTQAYSANQTIGKRRTILWATIRISRLKDEPAGVCKRIQRVSGEALMQGIESITSAYTCKILKYSTTVICRSELAIRSI